MEKCPVCGGVLVPGYITSKGDALNWSDPQKRPISKIFSRWSAAEDQIRLTKFRWKTGWTIDSPYCPNCVLIFIDPKEEPRL